MHHHQEDTNTWKPTGKYIKYTEIIKAKQNNVLLQNLNDVRKLYDSCLTDKYSAETNSWKHIKQQFF